MMAAVCSCRSRFFKFLCFVALFAECLGTCIANLTYSPSLAFTSPFSVGRKLFSASCCGQNVAAARRSTQFPIIKWSKHGSTIFALSERGFIKDLSIARDVATNPGPEFITYTPTALLRTSRSRFSYSRHNLLQLRSCCAKVKLDYSLIHRLKSLGICTGNQMISSAIWKK